MRFTNRHVHIRFMALFIGIVTGFLSILLPCPQVIADKVRPLNLEQLVEGSGVIFEGKCTDVRTGKDPDTGMISTWITFKITQGLKGKLGDEYVLKQFGGSDGTMNVKTPSVTYEVGETVVLFLYETSRIGFSSAVGLHQGKFAIKEITESKVRYATNGIPSMMLFENMRVSPPALNAKGMKAQGQEMLRSDKLELHAFLSEIKNIVQLQEKNKNLQEQ